MNSSSTTLRNITAICEMEKRELGRRTVSARIGDAIASHAGRMWFILVHLAWFAVWIALNWHPHGHATFDPFPFPFLTVIVSLESIFLSLFILMSQNRSGLQAERRNHLDLQINLLSEDENTKILLMLRALCKHHKLNIGDDLEITAMAQKTKVTDVLSELDDNLPCHD